MKQAICLLAYKSIEYVQSFINQFENHPDIYFYIHWHGHSDEECELLQKSNEHIRHVSNRFNTQHFSANLLYAELYLYDMVLKDNEIDFGFCHLMSESDYIICTPNFFCETFAKTPDANYISFITHDYHVNRVRLKIWNDDYVAQKASQWKSLNIKTVNALLQHVELMINLVESFYKRQKNLFMWGAIDEYIIPTVLINNMKIDLDNLSNNGRYINWENCLEHPNVLTLSKYKKSKTYKIIDKDVLSNLILRKIDILNDDSKNFLNLMKIKFVKLHKQ